MNDKNLETPDGLAALVGALHDNDEEHYLDGCAPYLSRCGSKQERDNLERLFLLGYRITQGEYRSRSGLRMELLRLAIRFRAKDGRIVPAIPNRVQTDFSARATQKNIVLKARQMGITSWAAALFFLETILVPGTLTVQVAHDGNATRQIFRIVHRFWANLPKWLRTGPFKLSRKNAGQLVFPHLDSEYRVETAGDTDAGRGLTIQNLHASEVARWRGDAYETLAALRAAVPPHGKIVLESTPNGAHGCFYEEWRQAAETGYTRHFYPWWWEEMYVATAVPKKELTEDERELVKIHSLTPGQIGFRREIDRSHRRFARQEFAEDPESCFLASRDCYFELEMIEQRLKALADEEDEGDGLHIFLPPQRRHKYVIGADTAGGGSQGDYCCAQVVDMQSGGQCAELHGRWTPPEFTEKLIDLGERYNEAVLAVEKNQQGHGVLALLRGRYPNIYEERSDIGFTTNASNRPMILANLAAILVQTPECLNSRKLLMEMRTFVRKETGRTEAARGANDDRVMAMAIAYEARRAGA